MTDRQPSEALDKLEQGIEESRRTMQRQTLELAQEYFGDSVRELKRRIQESRSTLDGLPDQLPGGQEESFQMLFRDLMNSYEKIESCLEEAEREVSGLDIESLRRQGEIEASEAALREARDRGVDLTQVEGSGSGGRVVVEDVKEAEPEATDAARREAEKRGIDLSEVEPTGAEGRIIVSDVVEFAAKRGGSEVADTEAREAKTSSATGSAEEPQESENGQVEAAAGEVAEEAVQETSRVTNAARRKAEDLGVDLSSIQGSGAGGLITIKDVVGGGQ